MDPVTIISLFNLIAPHAFRIIGDVVRDNPGLTYQESLEQAGVKLDAEHARLLADMARAVEEGAVPRTPGGV